MAPIFQIVVPFLIIGLLPLTGSELFKGWPSIGHGQLPHIHPHMLGGDASGGDLCAPKSEEVKVDWEPWHVSKH